MSDQNLRYTFCRQLIHFLYKETKTIYFPSDCIQDDRLLHCPLSEHNSIRVVHKDGCCCPTERETSNISVIKRFIKNFMQINAYTLFLLRKTKHLHIKMFLSLNYYNDEICCNLFKGFPIWK